LGELEGANESKLIKEWCKDDGDVSGGVSL